MLNASKPGKLKNVLPKQLRASALITALFIMALTATLATSMAVREGLLINQTELLLQSDQLSLYIQGLEQWGMSRLEDLEKKGVNNSVLHGEVMPTQHINGATLNAKLIDAQSLYNVNQLFSSSAQPQLLRILKKVVPNFFSDLSKTNILLRSITDWVSSEGVKDEYDYYSRLKPPYQAAHIPFAKLSELRAVRGVTAKRYQQMAPYLTALPVRINQQPVKLNVNTASAVSLLSLDTDPVINYDAAKELVTCRSELDRPMTSTDFLGCLTRAGLKSQKAPSTGGVIFVGSDKKFDFQSYYFLLNSEVRSEGSGPGVQCIHMQSLLRVNPSSLQPASGAERLVDVVWRGMQYQAC